MDLLEIKDEINWCIQEIYSNLFILEMNEEAIENKTSLNSEHYVHTYSDDIISHIKTRTIEQIKFFVDELIVLIKLMEKS